MLRRKFDQLHEIENQINYLHSSKNESTKFRGCGKSEIVQYALQ